MTYDLKGTMAYCAPEILSNYKYSKAGDVYAFGYNFYKKRPSFDFQIPKCYKNLIEICWSQEPEKRPSFEQIVTDIKNNPEFIFEDADEVIFSNFIDNMDSKISRKQKILKKNEQNIKNDEEILKEFFKNFFN